MSVSHIKSEIISQRVCSYLWRDHYADTPISAILVQAGFDLQKPYDCYDGKRRDGTIGVYKQKYSYFC